MLLGLLLWMIKHVLLVEDYMVKLLKLIKFHQDPTVVADVVLYSTRKGGEKNEGRFV
jgi:hypothetical protein